MNDLNAILERIEKLAWKATPGPWEWTKPNPEIADNFEDQHNIYPPLGERGPVLETSGEGNAAFLAASRELVPALCKALRLAIEQRNDVIRELANYGGVFNTGIEDAKLATILCRDADRKGGAK